MKLLQDALFVVYITTVVWLTWTALTVLASLGLTYFLLNDIL